MIDEIPNWKLILIIPSFFHVGSFRLNYPHPGEPWLLWRTDGSHLVNILGYSITINIYRRAKYLMRRLYYDTHVIKEIAPINHVLALR